MQRSETVGRLRYSIKSSLVRSRRSKPIKIALAAPQRLGPFSVSRIRKNDPLFTPGGTIGIHAIFSGLDRCLQFFVRPFIESGAPELLIEVAQVVADVENDGILLLDLLASRGLVRLRRCKLQVFVSLDGNS